MSWTHDGVYTFVHPYGCSQLGDDLNTTRKILAGLVNHPNAAGVLVLGLGCENNNIASFKQYLMDTENALYNNKRIRFLSLQETDNDIEAGLSLISELVEYAEDFVREPCPVSSLTVGLNVAVLMLFQVLLQTRWLEHYPTLLFSMGVCNSNRSP